MKNHSMMLALTILLTCGAAAHADPVVMGSGGDLFAGSPFPSFFPPLGEIGQGYVDSDYNYPGRNNYDFANDGFTLKDFGYTLTARNFDGIPNPIPEIQTSWIAARSFGDVVNADGQPLGPGQSFLGTIMGNTNLKATGFGPDTRAMITITEAITDAVGNAGDKVLTFTTVVTADQSGPITWHLSGIINTPSGDPIGGYSLRETGSIDWTNVTPGATIHLGSDYGVAITAVPEPASLALLGAGLLGLGVVARRRPRSS